MTDEAVDDALSVLDRMTQILQAFDQDDRGVGLGLSELARHARLPKSTVSRLVATLVRQRYLERDGRHIHLGLRVFELGQLAREPRELRIVAIPTLLELRDRTGENVHLALRDGREIVCVAALRGRSGAPTRVRVGARLPIHSTALGKAVLAHAPASVIDDVIAAGLAPSTPLTITDEQVLRQQLADIRRGGLALETREFAPDGSCLATAVFAPGGRLAGAVSVSGREGELDIARVTPLLLAAGGTLTRRLAALASASG